MRDWSPENCVFMLFSFVHIRCFPGMTFFSYYFAYCKRTQYINSSFPNLMIDRTHEKRFVYLSFFHFHWLLSRTLLHYPYSSLLQYSFPWIFQANTMTRRCRGIQLHGAQWIGRREEKSISYFYSPQHNGASGVYLVSPGTREEENMPVVMLKNCSFAWREVAWDGVVRVSLC